jgi:hypothetical protein
VIPEVEGVGWTPLFTGRDFVFCVLVGNLHVSFVLEALADLDREVSAAIAGLHHITVGALDALAATKLARSRDGLRLMQVKIELLRERALGHVETHTALDARELDLRARTNLILIQLDALARVPLASRLFVGRFKDLHDVRAYLLGQIGRLNETWLREHRAFRAQPGAQGADRLMHLALGKAELAFALLGCDPDLAHFLRVGASSRTATLRSACREIAASVDARLVPALPCVADARPANAVAR